MHFCRMMALAGAASVTASTAVGAVGSVDVVDYFSLTTTSTDEMESYPNGNLDGVVTGDGVAYGEHFAGQTLTSIDRFDALAGQPTGPLTLNAGVANQNLATLVSSSRFLLGLSGAQGGWSSTDAIGEGAIAILFDVDQAEVGFEFRGASNGGDAFISFFGRNGSLLDAITIADVANGGVGFRTDTGMAGIAGLVITNEEVNGFGIDNLRYNVPTPAAPSLFAGAALLLSRRRRTA